MANPSLYLIGLGTTLSITPLGGTATVVNGLKSVQTPNSKMNFEDVTTLSSVAREWFPTLEDGGESQLDGFYAPTDPGQIAVFAAYSNKTLCTFTLQFPIAGTQTTKGDSITWTGFVEDRPTRTGNPDKTVSLSVKIKVTAAVTEVAGS